MTMGQYQKSAKDKAFDRERTKLQSQIAKLRSEVEKRDTLISTLGITIQQQAKTVEELDSKVQKLASILKLTDEERKLLFSKEKHNAELLNMMHSLFSFGGIRL